MQKMGLLEQLIMYGKSDYYPFHMPGHKRQDSLGITSFPNPFSVDITEIDGFDNLHHAEGILKDSMEQAARIYGADRTWYLVNGSSGGILSAISAVTRPGDKILMGRNCHKSAYHAVMLNRLEPVYVYPEELKCPGISRICQSEELSVSEESAAGSGILGGLAPEKIEAALDAEPGVKAIFITSPTYEGIVSDVAAIAEAAHRHGIPLIVDEAHGAHFTFGEDFPASALDCGADVVIQSLHKTLPSLTQTAVIHLKSSLVNAGQLERYLSVYQSSSPSYVFMAVMERCVRYMDGKGRKQMKAYGARLHRWMEEAKSLRYLRVLDDEICGNSGVYARDLSKLVVLVPGVIPAARSSGDSVDWLDGTALSERLREKYHLEAEMSCSRYVILMTSVMDTEEGLKRLMTALKEIDAEYAACREAELFLKTDWKTDTSPKRNSGKENAVSAWLSGTVRKVLPADAWHGEKEKIALSHAVGRVAGSFVTVYPPGVPMLVPGEVITEEAVQLIWRNYRLGLTVEGIEAKEAEEFWRQLELTVLNRAKE